MFINLTENKKEELYMEIIDYANKIKNEMLKKVCLDILNDFKNEFVNCPAGHASIEGKKNDRTHQCFDGGLLHHSLNVTKNAYNIGKLYENDIDMDLIIFGAALHDIGKTKMFDVWNNESIINGNLDYRYQLVDHVYLGEKIIEEYLDKTTISKKYKYQVMHIISTHMDKMTKHMAEAYIVSYADSIDADIENLISYPRNDFNPIYGNFIYKSEKE